MLNPTHAVADSYSMIGPNLHPEHNMAQQCTRKRWQWVWTSYGVHKVNFIFSDFSGRPMKPSSLTSLRVFLVLVGDIPWLVLGATLTGGVPLFLESKAGSSSYILTYITVKNLIQIKKPDDVPGTLDAPNLLLFSFHDFDELKILIATVAVRRMFPVELRWVRSTGDGEAIHMNLLGGPGPPLWKIWLRQLGW